MPIKYSTERVLDMTLRALRASGLIADDVSAQTIRDVANSSTDAQLDALALTLNYGGTASTNDLFAPGNLHIVIDSDNSESGIGPYYDEFRVWKGASTLPITDPLDMLMTVGGYNFTILPPWRKGALLTIGPTKTYAMGTGADYRAALSMGFSNSISEHLATFYAGKDVDFSGDEGLHIYARKNLRFTALNELQVTGQGKLKGGFPDLINAPRFDVGDFVNDDSLAISQDVDLSGNRVYNFRTTGGGDYNWFFHGTPSAGGYAGHFVFGGTYNVAWSNPTNLGNATVCAISPSTDTRTTLYVYSRQLTMSGDAEVMTINSAANPAFAADHYLLRIFQNGGAVFSVDGIAAPECHCPGGFVTTAADVAEYMEMGGEDVLPPPNGTVMVIDQNGKLIPSEKVADTAVAGVISTNAGVTMGESHKYDDSNAVLLKDQHLNDDLDLSKEIKFANAPSLSVGDVLRVSQSFYEIVEVKEDRNGSNTFSVILNDKVGLRKDTQVYCGIVKRNVALVAAVGRVPVRCTSLNGPIIPGTRLVSGPNGCAVAAPKDVDSSAILGKSLGRFDPSEGVSSSEGKVDALVSW